MITIHIIYDENRSFFGFRASGHAGYQEYGKDIVCSAVSALTLNMINATLEYTDTDIIFEQGESGLLRFKYAQKPGHDAILLFQAMLLGLQSIEEEYGKEYLRIIYLQKLSNKHYISIDFQEV